VVFYRNPLTRLQEYYQVIDKNSEVVDFKPNWAQQHFFENMHYKNVVLKCRQIGMSTFCCLLFLDLCLWRRNFNAAIISHSREAASDLMRKATFALDNLDPALLQLNPPVNKSATSIHFTNGSHLQIATSARGGTLNALLVSEFGRLSARFPTKAQEIVTGSIQALSKNAFLIIESTAEGTGNLFHQTCKQAKKNLGKDKLSKLEYKFHFYPWHLEPEYVIDHPYKELQSSFLDEYFEHIESTDKIQLTEPQKAWYSMKYSELGEQIRSEYPSTPDEAFQTSSIANFYLADINAIDRNGQIKTLHADPSKPVQLAVDLGVYTSIFLFQLQHNGEVFVLDHIFIEGGNILDIIKIVQSKPFVVSKWYLPHDAESRIQSIGKSWVKQFQEYGIPCEVLPRESIELGINRVRLNLPRTYFNKDKCLDAIEHLKAYRRKFNLRLGMYSSDPEHDVHSHVADSLRYVYEALEYSQPHSTTGELRDKHNAFLQRRNQILI
jgi:hypothetical protein